MFRLGLLALTLAFVAPVWAGDEPKKSAKPADPVPAKSLAIPYKLTDTSHVMVRVKINGKGPYNFIIDTGAPIMLLATPIGKRLGLENDKKGFATIDEVEIEGGLIMDKVRCRIETPFQLEGMNGMGLAGAELHGILGYTILAKHRMTIDLTKDKMEWTPLAWEPPPPVALGGKGNAGGLEMVGTLMKFLGPLLGLKASGPPEPRGFLGFEFQDN